MKAFRDFPAREVLPGDKKAGRFPVRAREGPTKNLLIERQRNAQQGARI